MTLARIQIRRGTTAQWTAANPILANGEPGLDTDTKGIKYGDGVLAWLSLPWGNATPWVAPTLGNGWLDWAGGYQTARYRRIGDVTYIEGLIKSGTINTTAFTLPVGFRPAALIQFASVANAAFSMLVVSNTGAVTPSVGVNTNFQLNCCFGAVL